MVQVNISATVIEISPYKINFYLNFLKILIKILNFKFLKLTFIQTFHTLQTILN
jgi:hypothetical protein